MKLLVIGAEGQVGHFLMEQLKTKHEAYGTSMNGINGYPRLDITDETAVDTMLREINPDHVILSAAYTDVDGCESDPEKAYKINVAGPTCIANACAAIGCGLTFYSTEYVFDGVSGPYTEDDEPNPQSVYGKTKLEAEKKIASRLENVLIIRTTVVYSYLPGSVNFFMQLFNRVKNDEPIRVVDDQIGNPTHACNLAGATIELIEQQKTGLYNLVGKTRIGRDGFARAVLDKLGYKEKKMATISTAALKQQASRPLNAGLITNKADECLETDKLWTLDQALDYTLNQVNNTEC